MTLNKIFASQNNLNLEEKAVRWLLLSPLAVENCDRAICYLRLDP